MPAPREVSWQVSLVLPVAPPCHGVEGPLQDTLNVLEADPKHLLA